MIDTEPKIGGILLAAGGSSRFGSPKQLAEYNGKPLFRIAAEAIASTRCRPVVAVLGSNGEAVRALMNDLDILPAFNPAWETGLSSSIRVGLESVLKAEPEIDAVLITLGDQPLVTTQHLSSLLDEFVANRPPIVAAKYREIIGVPALFSRELFSDLLSLSGDKGARDLIRSHSMDVRTIEIEDSVVDIDTIEDLASFI